MSAWFCFTFGQSISIRHEFLKSFCFHSCSFRRLKTRTNASWWYRQHCLEWCFSAVRSQNFDCKILEMDIGKICLLRTSSEQKPVHEQLLQYVIYFFTPGKLSRFFNKSFASLLDMFKFLLKQNRDSVDDPKINSFRRDRCKDVLISGTQTLRLTFWHEMSSLFRKARIIFSSLNYVQQTLFNLRIVCVNHYYRWEKVWRFFWWSSLLCFDRYVLQFGETGGYFPVVVTVDWTWNVFMGFRICYFKKPLI